MAKVIDYPSPHAEKNTTAYVGMIVFIAGWGLMFASIFFIYGAMRLTAVDWPPLGLPLLPVGLPALSTALAVATSGVLEVGLRAMKRHQPRAMANALLAAIAGGFVFLLIQTAVVYIVYGEGLELDRGAYAAVFYGLSGIHAAHVLVGLFALAVLWVRTLKGRYSAPDHLPLRLWTIYWHFVGIIWVLIFLLVFLT